MSRYVIIGTSPFNDVSVTVGPVNSYAATVEPVTELEHRGWVTEVCELTPAADVATIGFVTNDEGV